MSAESTADHPDRPDAPPAPVDPDAYRTGESASSAPSIPLHVEIERAKRRTRIAALERELAAANRRRLAIIEQYERLLEDRTCTCDDDPADDRPLLRRLR